MSDVLIEIPRSVDSTTLNDTILPYVIAYKKSKSLSSWKHAYSGFLKELRAALKNNTNNKGNLGLSFGGENASENDNRFLPTTSKYAHRSFNPECDDQEELINYTIKYYDAADRFYTYILQNVDSVDFDMENAGFSPKHPGHNSPQPTLSGYFLTIYVRR